MTTRIEITAGIVGTTGWAISAPICTSHRQFDVNACQRRCIGGERDTRTDTLNLFAGRRRRVHCRKDGWCARAMVRIDGTRIVVWAP